MIKQNINTSMNIANELVKSARPNYTLTQIYFEVEFGDTFLRCTSYQHENGYYHFPSIEDGKFCDIMVAEEDVTYIELFYRTPDKTEILKKIK